MALTPGDKLGPYEILEPIGKGGMGEVYRARDTRLGRDVAVKISSKEFNERFEREARAISSLNHPNICTLHDIGSAPEVPGYLVMEFVEGETLSKILSRGPLPLDKALLYAGQITDALAAAHAKGIIHRDLKPGNIMITPHGVKVLDFGLAKLGQVQLAATGSSEVATMTEPITQSGSIVGTLHYMSPEQVEGKDVDERSDIFAFGAVLYEMITGQRAFDGDSKAAIMAAVMKDQPPSVRQVRNDAPRSLDRLIRKCLEKKPDDRWQTARDLKPTIEMIDLDAVSSGSMSGASGAHISSASVSGLHAAPGRSWLVPALSVVAVLALGGFGWMLWNGSAEEPVADAVQFELGANGTSNLTTTLATSPDGRQLAFIATGVDGKTQLWIRTLETLEAHPLSGTEGAAGFPFWSWDSKSVVFTDGQALRKVDAAGGPAQILTQTANPVVGGFWTPEDRIIVGLLNQGIFELPAGGGELTRRLTAGAFPNPLPDGQHFLFLGDGGIHVAALPEPESAEATPRDDKVIIPGDGNGIALYSPAPRGGGYLVMQRPGTESNGSFTLMAQPFDADTLTLGAAAVPVAETVPLAGFTVSATGVLIYSTGALNLGSNLAVGSVGVLTWFDRTGVVQGTVGQSAFYDLGFRLSPDGTRVAASRDGDIWVTDLERGGTTKLTFTEDIPEFTPIWSLDGTDIVYVDSRGMTRQGYKKPANGAGDPELLYEFEDPQQFFVGGLSPQNRYLLVYSVVPGDVFAYRMGSAEGDPKKAREKFVQLTNLPDADERGARWSPNGRYFAYTSNETGRDEAFVRAFNPETGALAPGKWMISTNGGVSPHWRADGREMYYLAADANMMAVQVNTEGDFESNAPETLFRVPVPGNFWEASADGQQFLIPVPEGQSGQAPYRVVLNWTSTLR